MRHLIAGYSKGQMKIQQMAFMLVMIVIFFLMVGMVFFSIMFSNLRSTAEDLRQNEAKEIVKSISGSPELAFTSSRDCTQCIDFDKALYLKEMIQSGVYSGFWSLDYLVIEKVDPSLNGPIECTPVNFPDCTTITLIGNDNPGLAPAAFTSLAHWDKDMNDFRYDFGRIYASGVNLDK